MPKQALLAAAVVPLAECAWEICKPRSGVKSSAQAHVSLALKTASPLSDVFPLRSKRCAVIALEFLDTATLKAERFECRLKEVAPTLSRPLRGLRQGVAQHARCAVGRLAPPELRVGDL